MSIYLSIKSNKNQFLNYYRSKIQFSDTISFRNWVKPPAPQDFWLAQFVETRKLLSQTEKLVLFSVFGLRTMMRFNCSHYKIFVARENVHRPNWSHYEDLCLNEKWIDLVVGFDYLEHDKYIRFPLWLMWIFEPTATYENIKQICKKINNPNDYLHENRKFCSFLASHNDIGRHKIYEELSTINKVDCDGKLFHNNNDLKTKFGDHKLDYLQQYRFNLCPENSNADGYCTEKVFEAIHSGCIPIYWGSNNNPEPNILNHDAILFINIGEKNDNTITQIRKINENPKLYQEFANQPRLTPEAPELIWEYFCNLEKMLKEITKNAS